MKLWCFFIVLVCAWAFVVTAEPPTDCTTPNGEKASCVVLFNCPTLLKASQATDPQIIKFIQASACGTENFMVCCGTSATFKPNTSSTDISNKNKQEPSKEARRKYARKHLLPSKTYCGLQHTDDYYYNGTTTSVDEFPWMVYISAILDSSKIESNSVGFLISNRYILTDKNYNRRSVILGQHIIYKDVSCIGTPFEVDDCTNPSIVAHIDDTFIQEKSNIALLRLTEKISYTDYIRPLCLPIDDQETPEVGDTVVTSGWGEEDQSEGKDVKIKKRIKYNLMNQEDCELGNSILNPVCGLAFKNSTSFMCHGDNGGPLMYRYTQKEKNWVALGVATGNAACSKYQPVVAERITPEIVDWILENMRP